VTTIPATSPAEKLTPARRTLLHVVRSFTVRCWANVTHAPTGLSFEFFWAPDLGGRPGRVLTERTVQVALRARWIEVVSPSSSSKPASWEEMIERQKRMTLRVTKEGLLALGAFRPDGTCETCGAEGVEVERRTHGVWECHDFLACRDRQSHMPIGVRP
jgi:hypothetical protein